MALTACSDDKSMTAAARTAVITLLSALALTGAPEAFAVGGGYVFAGGTPSQHAEVRAALDASAFDWDVVPTRVTIHLSHRAVSSSSPGHIRLDSDILSAGMFAWATIQDEYAHQVDYFLFDDAMRARLTRVLGGRAWGRTVPGLSHAEYGCERFASTLVWAYWPSVRNAYRPESKGDESAAMPPARFRALMKQLLLRK